MINGVTLAQSTASRWHDRSRQSGTFDHAFEYATSGAIECARCGTIFYIYKDFYKDFCKDFGQRRRVQRKLFSLRRTLRKRSAPPPPGGCATFLGASHQRAECRKRDKKQPILSLGAGDDQPTGAASRMQDAPPAGCRMQDGDCCAAGLRTANP